MEQERRLLSHLIRTLNEGGHPALQALRALLDQDPLDPERLRALCHLLLSVPVDSLAGPGAAMPGRIGAQLVGMALDRWAGYLPPGALRQPLTEILRALRFHGPALAEALAALLGAFWLRREDPAWALELARRAERLLQDRQRAAALQGMTSPELAEWLRWAREIIGEILRDRHLAAAEPPREEAPERTPAEPISTPGGPLRPARLALLSLILLPDTHPQAGDLQFLDPQTAERLSDSAEVQIERLCVGEQVYRVYVEADMAPIVVARREELIVLRVEGESMRGAGIEPGDLILARRIPGPAARDPNEWRAWRGRLVLAVLVEDYHTQAHRAFLIKRLNYRNGKWFLSPENPAFEEIAIEPGRPELYPVLAILKPEPPASL
ncbi:LexA family protein [Thermoflexus hugenholtzii]|uniref:SOS-response transcriptional repressors (RecA-mediated autopeptidases) n=1 Tax=Thermoflexus hugenholtzii JAD2 TaxID=877466 RepID=A0A212QQ16_9CHLR|nr:S24 family peptidase [Thermoflexus hugenholtzii]SNB61529.1 SOS-response transcriptional repressors (RecA-mediated autopeptidases) [Thermoflexus hugenholtzii JAD2]